MNKLSYHFVPFTIVNSELIKHTFDKLFSKIHFSHQWLLNQRRRQKLLATQRRIKKYKNMKSIWDADKKYASILCCSKFPIFGIDSLVERRRCLENISTLFARRPFLLFLPLQPEGCRCHGKKFMLASWPLFVAVVLQGHLPFAPCVIRTHNTVVRDGDPGVRGWYN